ncbi:MAG: MerC domain-containing protein [Leptospiraceae bacterium]|nr:MerC domain-containing protein [Leptospiraceae bacterium]
MLSILRKNLGNLDSISAVGMFLSIACTIHCLAFPLIILLAPLTGIAFFENEILEHLSLLVSILIAGFTLFSGFKIHRKVQLVALFLFAIIILVGSNWFMPILFKPWTDALGALSIASTLFWNLKLTHIHQAECKH